MHRILFAVVLAITLVFAAINLSVPIFSFGHGRPDFVAFYGAWRMTVEGKGEQLYDIAVQNSYQPVKGESFLPYPYPPHVTTPLAPLGLMPYKTSLAVWLALQYLILSVLLWRFWSVTSRWSYKERLLFVLTVASSPFVFISLVNGAFSLIVTLALLSWSTSENDTAKGAWLAAASLKPHFAVFPLIADVAGLCWRSLATFCAITFVLVVVALPIYGWHAWRDYFELLKTSEAGGTKYTIAENLMPTIKSLIVMLGSTPAVAVFISAVAFLIGTVVILLVWRSKKFAGPKASLTISLGLFLSPHANPYDTIVLAITAFLTYEALRGTTAGRLFALFIIASVLLYNMVLYSHLWIIAWRMPLLICCFSVGWSLFVFFRNEATSEMIEPCA